jgi:hypothetical protein
VPEGPKRLATPDPDTEAASSAVRDILRLMNCCWNWLLGCAVWLQAAGLALGVSVQQSCFAASHCHSLNTQHIRRGHCSDGGTSRHKLHPVISRHVTEHSHIQPQGH